MTKILAVSDLHCHDYPQRNPSEKFRLYQTRLVANNIIEVAKNNGAEIIVLAGDILEKSVVRPYVQAEAKFFLDALMAFFKSGFIIWGNHDEDNRHQEQLFTDACLSVMLPPNLFYADQRQCQIGSSIIGFSNWKPQFDLSWISGKLDVLFTHATISYSPGDLYKSQVLDESKFDLAICGDIHQPVTKGKYVSIGVPQRCKMGDSEKSTGVIYDTESKKWEWVNLNPKDNLLKFQYTPKQQEEGYNEISNTWFVYKPENHGKLGTGREEIKIPAWEEVGHLIDNIIIDNGLEVIHSEVIKNSKDVESFEVDFDFRITRFYCKNWRSIEEIELFFNDLDKILIRGQNGSGKSSLLSAIKYAFIENRFIKDFIQFDQKECISEVDFIYQGKLCRIQRGSKKWGLLVDGEPIKYGSKKEFEEDMHRRFPFIDYMDVFFFDEDHLKLIGDISPERKSELISKFFRLDRIDYFNSVAIGLLGQLKKSVEKYQEIYDNSEKLINFIDSKLSQIILPSLSEDDLEKAKQEGMEIQRRYFEYNNYITKITTLSTRLDILEKDTLGCIESLKLYKSKDDIYEEIKLLEKNISDLEDTERILRNRQEEIRRLQTELWKIEKTGNELYGKLMGIVPDTCPTCNQKVNSEKLNDYKNQLQGEIDKLLLEKQEKQKFLSELSSVPENNSEDIFKKLSEYRNLRNSMMMNIGNINQLCGRIDKNKEDREKILQEKSMYKEVLETKLPDNFMEKMSEIDISLQTWKTFNNFNQDKQKSIIDLENSKIEINKISIGIDLFDKYIKLTSTTGKIYEEIMGRLSQDFSDNQVKYEVVTYNFRKKDHLDLSSYYNKSGQWVSYQSCSSGQKTILDINFLSKIITRLGLLVMDEFLKSLDPENHDICIEMISGMNVGCIMLSSHMESITTFNNKSMKLGLNDSGITTINLE